MKIHEALKYIQSKLQKTIGIYAIAQSEEILEFFLKCSRTDLYIKSDKPIPPDIIPEIDTIVERRLNGEPLQYILGKAFFYSRDFIITPEVLIPRPDTEILVEQVFKFEKGRNKYFIDIGTGSGIIASILTDYNPDWKGIAVDISYKSLLVARQNIKNHVYLLCCNMLTPLKEQYRFDFIVSNPPYISADELETLDREVKDFEPHRALFGGTDGLDFYRLLAERAKNFLKPNGAIYCEIGYNQETDVVRLFSNNNWKEIRCIKDLGGNSRVIRALTGDQ